MVVTDCAVMSQHSTTASFSSPPDLVGVSVAALVALTSASLAARALRFPTGP
jgi:Ca2+/H+ antiporter